MKPFALLLTLLLLFSCAEKKPEALSEEKKLDATALKDAVEVDVSDKVPSYNFEELSPYLSKQNDTTYVVNFWATWCKPCIKELPAFEKINADYSEEKVKVLLVSLDDPRKINEQVVPFMEKNSIQSDVILLNDSDANSWIPKVSEEWSGAIPATLIYKNARRKFYERSFTFEELEKEIKTIL